MPSYSNSHPSVSPTLRTYTSHLTFVTLSSFRHPPNSRPATRRAELPCRSNCRTNMDIDDLLAEVAVDTTPQESRDLQELTRVWVAERTAPEILTWPEDLMDRVLERIRRQVCCCSGEWERNKCMREDSANGVGRLSLWKIRRAIWIRRRISNSSLSRPNSSGSSFWSGVSCARG